MAGDSNDKPHILIVDDKSDNHVLLQQMLADLDVCFQPADSGEDAAKLTARHDYAIALIDVDLPGMDGFQTLEALHHNKKTRLLPVILFSEDYRPKDYKIKTIEAGAVDFMNKPIIPQILRGKVRTFLELYEHRQAAEKYTNKLSKTLAELKHAQKKLRLQSSALQAAADAIMITDNHGRICWVNSAFSRLTGYAPEEVIGQNPRMFKSGQHDEEFYRHLWQTVLAGKVWRSEMIDRRKDGTLFPMEIAISPVPDDNGNIEHFVAIKHDITERKQADKAREETIEAKSQFISMASHEVRTPLTAMKEGIRLVLDEVTGPLNEDQKELLDIAQRNVDRLARLINDLLDFQKLGSGKVEFDMQQNDINLVVTEIAQTMMPLVNEKQLELITELDSNIPQLVFDKDRITQVLSNVVNNAIKFTEQGTITITTDKRENIVQVSVNDTGPGITTEDLPKLFHEFEQLVSSRQRKTGGSGLGLAISRQIIKQHNAKIWAQSQPGKGTTVHFVLPINERRHKLRE